MKKNNLLILIISVLIIICAIVLCLTLYKREKKIDSPIKNDNNEKVEKNNVIENETKNFKIFNTSSKTRPYAIVVNNTPVAVKVQEGLNKAYLVYEFPTEGNTSRLMALYKDVDNINIGTIRSSRHNFTDYANENDAIFVCYGWSHYSEDELKKGSIDFINGISSKYSSVFWRSNPEKLASEHTAYTSISKIKDYVTKNNYRLESDNTLLLNYVNEDIDLSKFENSKSANTITLPYGNITTVFKYNKDTKEYTKFVNKNEIKDHKTKEKITTKNIIIVKIDYKMASDNYYWDLKTTGTGNGYYITNGMSVPIKWEKTSRNAKSKYTYLDGKEIEVNDGRTYIEVHTNKKKVTIE